MLKQVYRYTKYLLISICCGIAVYFVIATLENISEEKRLKEKIELEIEQAAASFKKSYPIATSGQTIIFLKDFINSPVMNDRLTAVDSSESYKIDKSKEEYLFAFSEAGKNIDIYIKKSFIMEEVYYPDIPEILVGLISTFTIFIVILSYSENKRQIEERSAELRKALKESESLALLGRMTATLAHELKTPISTIHNLVHALPSRASDTGFIDRFTTLVNNEISRTQQLIENLIFYGKELKVKKSAWIPLQHFMKDVARRVGIDCSVDTPAEISGDEFYLSLLFENLMRNSLQASATSISLRINMPSKDSPAVDILLEDNGSGFSPDHDTRELLNPFVTQRSKGSGLGLYLAQKIAKAHGGTMSLYNLPEGACVRIALPPERVRFTQRDIHRAD